MSVVEAEGLCCRVAGGGFVGAERDGSMWVCTGLLGKAEDEAMQVDICKPEVPHSLSCTVFEGVTCRDTSPSVKKKF